MQSALTVRDLLLPGEPLDPSEVVAGEGGLVNVVSWVVSLRPYPPAFPQLRGGELAIVATEYLTRLDPPVTLVGAIRYLAERGASGVAVRGEIGGDAVAVAKEYGFPLLRLLTEMPLQDIEQAVMRECALHEARREMLPQDRHAWVESLLGGRLSSLYEAQSLARKHGYTLASHYAVAYLAHPMLDAGGLDEMVQGLEEAFRRDRKAGTPMPIAILYEQGVAVLLPQGWEAVLPLKLIEGKVPCGVGSEKPALDAPDSLAEAQLAALASALLRGGASTRYADLGADRLLLLLHRDHPEELHAFVEETIGPLLRHDARSASPLLPTVEAFIRHGGRLRETAAEIYVHRNTLAYRLDRAAEILGVDLKDVGARLAVELALRALPLCKSHDN
ncbi:MAG TPA: PucR family transcriptional regulator [Chloroflexia bacterium]|nr:PucR family transcriptional regulator [Chloroflexia bacterium]